MTKIDELEKRVTILERFARYTTIAWAVLLVIFAGVVLIDGLALLGLFG